MTTTADVYTALLGVMGTVRGLRKGERNQQGGFNFRGIDATMNAVGPALREHGLMVVSNCRTSEYGEILVGKNRTPMGHARVVMEYTLIGADGSTIVGSAPGEAFDSGDKATAKACSVAYRTFWLQTLCLPTDEPDPDATSYERAEAPDDVILRHHKGDAAAAMEAAKAMGLDLSSPKDRAKYADRITQ